MNDIFWRLVTELNPFAGSGVGTSWYFIWIDIAFVTIVLYLLWGAIRGTRAIQLIQGIIVMLIVLLIVGAVTPFATIHWLVTTMLQPALVVAIPIVFQPELRRLLESLGQNGRILDLWTQLSKFVSENKDEKGDGRRAMVQTVAQSAIEMSKEGIGALIVFERNVGLQDHVGGGVLLDARVSWQLLKQIFIPSTPLHDMAVIIRGERILAANVMLPLSDEMGGVRRFGTRHRAARGITEHSDAVALVVSEETGTISLFYNREMTSNLSEESIVMLLMTLLHVDEQKATVKA
ncbi:MAG: hypothetical protein RLY87_2831 [Chloroflexota bacterium]|jgi:uncharacterized protein (TIGR00159 family)